MFTRRELLAGSAAAMVAGPALAQTAPARRNFVFITIDDLLSVVHSKRRFGLPIRTPYLDRLMAQGVSFSNAFASTALCNPSRTAFVSGMNPFRTGVHDNVTPWEGRIDLRQTFPGILAANGWRGFSYGKLLHWSNQALQTSGVCEEVIRHNVNKPQVDSLTVTDAINCIRGKLISSRAPWLLMVGLSGPHAPGGDLPQFLSYYRLESIKPLDWSGDVPQCQSFSTTTSWMSLSPRARCAS